MSWLSTTFSSSIGRKVTMSLTGLFLVTFLVIHLLGNLQLFVSHTDAGRAFNEYSVFMTTFLPIKVVSYVLYFSILFHAIQGLVLTMKNRAARPVGYHVNRANQNSSPIARSMMLLGTVVLAFIVMHMANFWFVYKFGAIPMQTYADGAVLKDMYVVVREAFSQWWYVAIYVVSMLAIGFHLWHGFASAFQSLGINHRKYTPLISGMGKAFSVLVPLAFAAIPVFMFILSLKQ